LQTLRLRVAERHRRAVVGLGEQTPERRDQTAKPVAIGTDDLQLVPQDRVLLEELLPCLVQLVLEGLHLPPKLNELGLGLREVPQILGRRADHHL
jgi:hypothetical protein